MNRSLNIVVASAVCWAASCRAGPVESAAGRISEVDGFVDIDLPVTQIIEDPGLVRIIARGEIADTVVGLEVDLPSKVDRSGDRLSLPLGAAEIRTIGAASDSFVTLLALRYRLPAPASAMVSAVHASVVGLEGDPARVLEGMTKMKFFFFDSGPEDRYAEVFIDVDPQSRVLGFHEKDPAYRKPLLLALTRRP